MSERGNFIFNLQLEQRAANAPVVALDLFSVTAQLVLVTESRVIQITKLMHCYETTYVPVIAHLYI